MRGILLTAAAAAAAPPISPFKLQSSKLYLPLSLSLSSAIPTTNNPKTSKPNFIPPSTRYPLPFLVFSLISLLTGLSGIAISDLQAQPVPVFRCGKSEDTFRAFYSGSGRRSID